MMRDLDDLLNFELDFDFGGWGPRRHRKRRRGRARWRVFERGDLKFVILSLIAKRPMHGYEVMRALEEASHGAYRASPGSVYPTLQMLEDQGYLTSREEDDRRVYRITAAGREYLEENQEAVEDVRERASSYRRSFFGEGVRDLSTAFRRLAQVTFEGAMRNASEPDVLDRMTDVLDRATSEMKKARRPRRDTAPDDDHDPEG